MTGILRYRRALLIAPLTVIPIVVAMMLSLVIFEWVSGSFTPPTSTDYLALFAASAYFVAISVVISYVATAVLGLPTYLILKKFGKATMASCVVLGGVLGALLGSVFILIPVLMITMTLSGASVATAFCALDGQRGLGRP